MGNRHQTSAEKEEKREKLEIPVFTRITKNGNMKDKGRGNMIDM